MRVILDTNVLIAGIFFSGPPAKILRAWRDGKLQLVVSTDILKEYYFFILNILFIYVQRFLSPLSRPQRQQA